MHVVGQDHPRVDGEWSGCADELDGLPEARLKRRIAEDRATAVSDDREEIRGTGVKADVIGHGAAS